MLEIGRENFHYLDNCDENLRPCPFCGNQASLITRYDKEDNDIYYGVECERKTCGARTGMWLYAKSAVEHWNRRVKNDENN